MTGSRNRFLVGLIALVGVGLAVFGGWYLFWDETGDPALQPFVHSNPPVPIVFTSRSNTASFRPAASRGDYEKVALQFPGQPQWQADEGRLRVLTPSGQVRELTWNRPLPDGEMLVDVMSPSVSLDGRTVYFAGRKKSGRFRLYAVGLDGSKLRQITGGADDKGCIALPPMRYDAQGNKLSDDERCQVDYDDIDPVEVPGGAIVFASSRLPDLGGTDRRATQLWMLPPGQPPRPMTASRANDRWPYPSAARLILFSVWSRQNEVISGDGTKLMVNDPEHPGLTNPVDRWLGAGIMPSGEHFSAGVKIPAPVWRPRSLATGMVAFMTTRESEKYDIDRVESEPFRLGMAPYGTTLHSPSSLAAGSTFPQMESPVIWAGAKSSDGREWSVAMPSPCTIDRLVVSAVPLEANKLNAPAYGVYSTTTQNWNADGSGNLEMTLLFDDPKFVDAEPVAAIRREIPESQLQLPSLWPADELKSLTYKDAPTDKVKAGRVHNAGTFSNGTLNFPGQASDAEKRFLVPPFPKESIEKIHFYASRRDRFDDPKQPVVRGKLEFLGKVPIDKSKGGFEAVMPTSDPTLLVGIGPDGKAASVIGGADAKKNRGKFYAYAGDHVSGTKPGAYHFCTGCHAGHTVNNPDLREKLK
jgi:hypothetical protein